MKKKFTASKILVLALIATLPFLSGCGALLAERLIDTATDNMIKLMEAEAKINAEKRALSYTVEGRFKELSMSEKVVPETDTSKIERKQDGSTTSIERPTKTIRTCLLTFADGRQVEFNNVPPKELVPGKKYLVTYNGLDEITAVHELED